MGASLARRRAGYGARVPSTCARCGSTSDADADGDGLPPGWSLETGPRGVTRLCAACTREHVRSIEAKLDTTWW
jgi:hypothetical protein